MHQKLQEDDVLDCKRLLSAAVQDKADCGRMHHLSALHARCVLQATLPTLHLGMLSKSHPENKGGCRSSSRKH